MIGVSYLEIFKKSVEHFKNCNCLWKTGDYEKPAYIMAIISTITGILIMFLLDAAIFIIKKGNPFSSGKKKVETHLFPHFHHRNDTRILNTAVKGVVDGTTQEPAVGSNHFFSASRASGNKELPLNEHNNTLFRDELKKSGKEEPSEKSREVDKDSQEDDSLKKKKLKHLGLITALIITLHNIPEGLVTYIAALRDLKIGGALAFAIVVHNIPEGLCIAIPIYYGTGNRWKGFWFGFWSGVSEIIGALIGYAITNSTSGEQYYAALFGIVAGMMTAIVVKEMLPTAFEYDPSNKVVSYSFLGGFIVMLVSLILFNL
ncbi:zinc transporter ZupT-like [Zophobas morio]